MSKKIDLLIIYILMFLYSVYDILNSASAGNATTERGTVYIYLMAVVLGMALFTLLGRYIPKNNVLFTMFLFSVYYAVDMVILKGNTSWGMFVYLGLSIWWILTIIFFYNSVARNLNNLTSIRNFIRVMFILFSIAILYGSANISSSYSVDFARVGYIYHIMAMLPIILLLENNKAVKRIFIVAAIVLAIFSFKRGAIIAMPIVLLGYFITENKIGKAKNNILRLIITVVCIILAWLLIDSYSGGYLSERFSLVELSDGSGRSELIVTALNNISLRSFSQFLFGIRSAGESNMPMGPHNEWVGNLYYYGFVGVLLYAIVFIALTVQGIRLVRQKSIMASSHVAMLLYIYFIGLVSGLYFVHSTFYLMVYIAVIQGLSRYSDEQVENIIGVD